VHALDTNQYRNDGTRYLYLIIIPPILYHDGDGISTLNLLQLPLNPRYPKWNLDNLFIYISHTHRPHITAI